MQRFWNPVISPVIEASKPQSILNVSADGDAITQLLITELDERAGILHIAGSGAHSVMERLGEARHKRVEVHAGSPMAAIEAVPEVDLAILDDDPNWYTTFHTLKALERRALDEGRVFPVTLVHNVRWPYGRRDMYTDPERVPDEFRQPYAQGGVTPASSALVSDGLYSDRNHAVTEHGPRNGVRTAIDDFVADSYRHWRLIDVAGLGGLGVLVSLERLAEQPDLDGVLSHLTSPKFLQSQIRALDLARISSDATSWHASRRYEESRSRLPELEVDLRRRSRENERLAGDLKSLQARIDELERIHREYELGQRHIARNLTELEERAKVLTQDRSELIQEREELLEHVSRLRDTGERQRIENEHEQFRSADMSRELALLRSQLSYERAIREDALVLARRVSAAASWRWGHRFFSILRLITFRRNRGTDAAARLVHRLDTGALEPAEKDGQAG